MPSLGPYRKPLTDEEIRSSATATARANGGLDPLKFSDILGSLDSVTATVSRRLATGQTPCCPDTYEWPKKHFGDTRVMTYLDPFDQVMYRGLTGRLVRQFESQCDRGCSMAAVLNRSRPHWTLKPWGASIERRTVEALRLMESARFMATLDIENYFGSIPTRVIANAIARTRGPARTKGFLTNWLIATARQTGEAGLPVGHDASSVIGNVLLVPSDSALAALPYAHLRYMDDTWCFAPTEAVALEMRRIYEAAISPMGLKINQSKWAVVEGDVAGELIRSSANDYAEEARSDEDRRVVTARELFDKGREDPDSFSRELKRSLTLLAKASDSYATSALYEEPTLLWYAPDRFGNYLSKLAGDKRTRSSVDVDWIQAEILEPLSGCPDASRLTLLPVAGLGQASKDFGKAVLTIATDESQPSIVRATAATAWANTKAWKRDHAISLCESSSNLSVQRSFVASLRNRSGDTKVRDAVRHLASKYDDLRTTLDYVSA